MSRRQSQREAARLSLGALVGAVVSGVVIPALQVVIFTFLEYAPSHEGQYSFELLHLWASGLSFLPVVSTGLAMLGSYVFGGWAGAILYLIVASGASMMLNASGLGAVIFMTGTGMLVMVFVLKTALFRHNRSRP